MDDEFENALANSDLFEHTLSGPRLLIRLGMSILMNAHKPFALTGSPEHLTLWMTEEGFTLLDKATSEY